MHKYAIIAAIIISLPFTYATRVAVHEYAHCAIDWLQGHDGACTVIYQPPVGDTTPVWHCTTEPNSNIDPPRILCWKTESNVSKAYSTGDPLQSWEHPAIKGIEIVYGIFVAFAIWLLMQLGARLNGANSTGRR